MTTTFKLPFPPSVNMYRQPTRMGNHATIRITKEGKAYKLAVLDAVIKQHGSVPKAAGAKFRVSIIFVEPTHHVRDLDNFLKAPLDALTEAKVWKDDFQIDELSIKRGGYRKAGGYIDVTIERIEETKVLFQAE